MAYMSGCIRLWTSGTFYSSSYHKPKCKMPVVWSNPQNKTSPHKKILLLISYTEDTQSMSDSTYLYQSEPVFLTLTPNIPILFTAIPQHVISPIHCLGYTALLKTLHSHFWWDMLPCHYDPLTNKRHCASWLFQLGWNHSPLSRATHTIQLLYIVSEWSVHHNISICSCEVFPPSMTMSVFMELPVIVALFLVLNVPWMHPRPASPNFSGAPLAFSYTPLTNPSEVHCFSKKAVYFSFCCLHLHMSASKTVNLLHWNYMFCQHTYHHLFKFGITTSPLLVPFRTQVIPVALFCMWPGILVD